MRVKWINDLVDASGNFLPHLLPVDPTLHWANPPGGGRPGHAPDFASTRRSLHGSGADRDPPARRAQREESDGYPEAWYLPAANNIPAGFATDGHLLRLLQERVPQASSASHWEPGTAIFQYANDQRAATLWYHDHTLGMTRLNVYAGPAGFYLLRGGPGDFPTARAAGARPRSGPTRPGEYYEIPIAIQDRSLQRRRLAVLPGQPRVLRRFAGPYIPDSDISPIWNPEFFGNTMVVNGRTWPFLEVEPRRYRFRFLNGCNSRFLILKLVTDPRAAAGEPALPFWQIGADGGFLPAPVQLDQLLLAPAERADVIVDFTVPGRDRALPHQRGSRRALRGRQPGRLRRGGSRDDRPGDEVRGGRRWPRTDTSLPPDQLDLPAFKPLGPASNTRQVSLNEEDSERSRASTARVKRSWARWMARAARARWTGTIRSPRTRRWMPPRSGRSTTSPRTPTPSTSTRCSSRWSTGADWTAAARGHRKLGDGHQGHRHRLSGRDHPRQGAVRPAGPATCGTATSSSTRTTR